MSQPELNDPDVVRHEVAKRIDIGTDPAQVETLAVNVADFSQLTRVDELFYVSDGSVVNESVPGHDDEALFSGIFAQFIHFTGFGGQRLLHKDMLAGFEHPYRQAEVSFSRGCNDHCIDFRII